MKNAGFSPEKLDVVVLWKDYWHILMISCHFLWGYEQGRPPSCPQQRESSGRERESAERIFPWGSAEFISDSLE
ncbi:hypothetical protein HMPREF1153_1264 [Selenomonas sp. CM52]|nr:hypothetical protein HMPREF1153_1264 [Selenomonas sp. CM52]